MSSGTKPGIVVGVSGSQGSIRALCWAAAEASRRRRPLRAILAWEQIKLAGYAPVAAGADRREQERAALAKLAAALRSAFGPVPLQDLDAYVVEGRAERVLAEESAGADLLVLGSALDASSSGFCIGPVVRGCLARARCPVVVIGTQEAAGAVGRDATEMDASASDYVRPCLASAGLVR